MFIRWGQATGDKLCAPTEETIRCSWQMAAIVILIEAGATGQIWKFLFPCMHTGITHSQQFEYAESVAIYAKLLSASPPTIPKSPICCAEQVCPLDENGKALLVVAIIRRQGQIRN